jgi:hypothetical protein
MAYRILKNAGYVPQEVELLKRLAELKEQRDAEPDAERRRHLQIQVAELRSDLKAFLAKLSHTGTSDG